MNEILYGILAFIVGLVLGMLFFGGLWITTKKAITSKIPALLFLGSFLFRTGITLIGFYYVAGGDLKKLLICLLGFMIARFIVMQCTKSRQQIKPRKEVSNGA